MDTGIIARTKKLSYDDLLLMFKFLKPYTGKLLLLLEIFETEEELLKFMDIFAGTTITFPPRSKIFYAIENVDIYNYYKSLQIGNEGLLPTAKRFRTTTQRVSSILKRANDKS